MNRLHLWWLKTRHTWQTRWSHKPLCERFQHDTLRLGSMRVCRSCSLLYAAFFLTLILGLMWGVEAAWITTTLWLLSPIVVLLSLPGRYASLPRWGRDLMRGGAGVLLALVLMSLLQGAFVSAGVWALVFALGARHYHRRRGERKQRACSGCPELDREGICSGVQPKLDGYYRYVRAAEERLNATYRPFS